MFSSLPKPLQNILQSITEAKENKTGNSVENHYFNNLNPNVFNCYASYNHPPDESYGRQLIYQDDKLRVLFMTWCPGDFTAIHNHGPAEWGYVYAFGNITHRIYKEKNQQLSLVNGETFEAGQLARVSSSLIHMMGNQGQQPVQSLHIYGIEKGCGPVETAKVYQPETLQVIETCGPAFLNLNEQYIVSTHDIEEVDASALLDYYLLVHSFYDRINKKEMLRKMLSKLYANT